MLGSPLIIGCDLRKADGFTKDLLQNKELIAINQDIETRTCYKLDCESSPGTFSLVKPLSGGSYAVGLFNFGDIEQRAPVSFWDMGISSAAGQKLSFHDCFMHGDAGTHSDSFCVRLAAHDCSVYIVKPV
jgi:alpha-galactosidase